MPDQQLFYARARGGPNFHLFTADAATSFCGYIDMPRTENGEIDQRVVGEFDSFATKPDAKWCDWCRQHAEGIR